jgi:hypothetical protein
VTEISPGLPCCDELLPRRLTGVTSPQKVEVGLDRPERGPAFNDLVYMVRLTGTVPALAPAQAGSDACAIRP